MLIKKQIHTLLKKSGWYVKRRNNLPPGIDWVLDLQRMLGYEQIHTILDVGANIGQTALMLQQELPQSTIHCFEPIPDTFTVLREKTAGHSQIHCHNLAMGSHEGSLEVMAVPLAWTNSLISGHLDNDPKARKVSVDISTLDLFCQHHSIPHISILKIDTEGYDLEVLQGCQKMLEELKIDAFYIEVTCAREDKKLHTFFPDVLNFLSSFSIRFVGLYETEPLIYKNSRNLYCNALFVNEARIKI
jgi:FkbM family methyltransferase